MRELVLEKVREAEQLAAQAQDGSATRAGWMRVARSWRLLAERMIAERTGKDVPIRILH